MADLEVVVTEGPALVVQVEEEPDVFVNVAIPPPIQVVEVQVPGPAGPPGAPGEPGTGEGVADHGALTGLSDDDHPQYHNDARGDARYLQSIPSTYATDAEVASAIGAHEAAADSHPQYQKESEKGTASGYASLDGDGLVPTSQLPPGSSAPADASTTVKGISKLSSAPAGPTNPIAVGDNDARIPTQGENDALAGTNGVPSFTNLFVTDSDPRNTDPRTPSVHGHDHVATLEPDSRLYDDSPTAYPVGVSSMPSTDYNTANRFASEHGEGAVKTTRYHNPTDDIENCIQVFEWSGGGIDFRTWSDLLSTWSGWTSVNKWDDIYSKPSAFPPSAHAASHKGDGSDPIANASTSIAGLQSEVDKTKLDGIETSATADQTASEILTAIKTVDGSGSGLDADTLDGHDTTYFAATADTRIPTQDENDALVGTNGTPSTSNKFVTNSDSRNTDTRTPTDSSVTNAKVDAAAAIAESKLNLASDAAAGTASRRTLGTSATQAAAGNDARLSDTRAPTDGSVTNAKVDAAAAIAESKLNLASDAAAGTASRRTLGTSATSAAAGNDSRLSDSRTPVQATETVAGGGEVATQTETNTGTDDTRIVTPLKLKNTTALDARYYTETESDARYLQSVPGTYATDAEVTSAISAHEALADPHTGYQKESEKNAANGYPGLGATPGTMNSTTVLYGDGVYRVPAGGVSKYSANVGDGSTANIAVTHSLGTKDVLVSLRRVSDDAVMDVEWTATSTTVITLNFAVAPTTNQYDITVVG